MKPNIPDTWRKSGFRSMMLAGIILSACHSKEPPPVPPAPTVQAPTAIRVQDTAKVEVMDTLKLIRQIGLWKRQADSCMASAGAFKKTLDHKSSCGALTGCFSQDSVLLMLEGFIAGEDTGERLYAYFNNDNLIYVREKCFYYNPKGAYFDYKNPVYYQLYEHFYHHGKILSSRSKLLRKHRYGPDYIVPSDALFALVTSCKEQFFR